MSVNLLWKRHAERHKENRPINYVESDDVLADDMHVCRPLFFVEVARIAVLIIADARNIVCERVKPNVNDVALVKTDGDSPIELNDFCCDKFL